MSKLKQRLNKTASGLSSELGQAIGKVFIEKLSKNLKDSNVFEKYPEGYSDDRDIDYAIQNYLPSYANDNVEDLIMEVENLINEHCSKFMDQEADTFAMEGMSE